MHVKIAQVYADISNYVIREAGMFTSGCLSGHSIACFSFCLTVAFPPISFQYTLEGKMITGLRNEIGNLNHLSILELILCHN